MAMIGTPRIRRGSRSAAGAVLLPKSRVVPAAFAMFTFPLVSIPRERFVGCFCCLCEFLSTSSFLSLSYIHLRHLHLHLHPTTPRRHYQHHSDHCSSLIPHTHAPLNIATATISTSHRLELDLEPGLELDSAFNRLSGSGQGLLGSGSRAGHIGTGCLERC